MLLDRYVAVYRLSQVSGDRTKFTTLTTSIESTVQPLSDSKGGSGYGSHEKMFRIYMDAGETVNEGDQIRDKDGNIYQIVSGGINKRTDGFMADYMGVTVKKINP